MPDDLIIKVPEKEFVALLARDQVIADINKHLRPWINVIHDLASYGSNLIPRSFGSSDRDLKDSIVLAVLLRQVVAMLDGVDLLLASGATYAAHLQLRALFEASVYIDWILREDSERKAEYYYVHNLRRKRFWNLKVQPGSAESQDFLDMMKKEGVQIPDEVRDAAKEQNKEIDRVLSQPKFAVISQDFEKQSKGLRDVSWYVPLGPRSLAAVAKAVDRRAQYVFLYSIGSEVMHSSSYERHMSIGKDQVTFQPIRSIEQSQNIFNFTATVTLATYRAILQQYREGELQAFGRKYIEKWQKEFLNFPKIKCQPNVIRL